MNPKYTIGVVGFGFVGKAIHHGFAQTTDFRIYDVNPLECVNTFEETLTQSDIIFICVPTPTDFETGGQDNSIMDSVIMQCVPYVANSQKVLVIKSTVIPGTTQDYIKKYPSVRVVFNPEFLTERTFRLDFINQSRIILGGNDEDTHIVGELYKQRFPTTPIFYTDPTSAEMVKYFCNCFFAAKLSFMNEMSQICEKLQINYDDVIGMVLADGRIGNSHWNVPGHDGLRGWGGKCFPKDVNALTNISKKLGVNPLMLQAAWEKNLEVREKHDWEDIPGVVSKGKIK